MSSQPYTSPIGQDWNPVGQSEANLRESILQYIRIRIVSGQIPSNQLLTVPSLSKQFGVSTTPIREALLELSNAGLIEPRRNRGFQVRETSPKELKDIFAIRAQLEAFALSLIDSCTADQADQLNALAERVAEAVRNLDTVGYISSDRDFHDRLIMLANNPKLAQIIMELRDNMRLYGIETQAGLERQQKSVEEHFELIRLLVNGQNAQACKLIQQHILDWQPIFLKALEGSSQIVQGRE